jgi:hypothetical protein
MKRYAISNSSIPSANTSTSTISSDLNINMKKHKPNSYKSFIPIQPVAAPSMMVTAPKGQLYIPGKDVAYDYDYNLDQERNELRRQQDEKNKELSKRINTLSPYYDDYGNRVLWLNSPQQESIESVYSSPMEIDPNDPPVEIGGYKKRRNKRRSNKKKRKSKRKSLKKRRKTRRK